jgi:hypothetical protein
VPAVSRDYRYGSGSSHYIFSENGISVLKSSLNSKVAFAVAVLIGVVVIVAAGPSPDIAVNSVLFFGTGAGTYAVVYMMLNLIAQVRSRAMLKNRTLEDLASAGKISSVIGWYKVTTAECRRVLGGWGSRRLTISWNAERIIVVIPRTDVTGAESGEFLAFLQSKLGNRLTIED